MRPRLIHPITVKIEQVDVDETVVDADFREPAQTPTQTGPVFLDPVFLKAQITWGAKDEWRTTPEGAGADYMADGHFSFLAADLRRAGISLHKGDRISTVGEDPAGDVPYRYTVVSLRPSAHYRGGYTILQATFKRLEGNE